MDTVVETIRRHAVDKPDAPVFWSPAGTWTFGELWDASERAASGLASLGIGPEDRVACLTKHTADCVVLCLAANLVGAVNMPINWRLSPSEIEYIVNNGGARFMMADEGFLQAVAQTNTPSLMFTVATEGASGKVPGFRDWLQGFSRLEASVDASPNDTALQLYSSGTTGLPKGVELTHENLVAGILGPLPRALGYGGAPDVMLNALPTYHIAGVGIGLMTSAAGGYSVLYPDFDPPGVIRAFSEHQVTHAFFVPAMIQFLLATPGVEEGDYASLRNISYGASPITQPVLLGGMETFKCDFMQVYGLTESGGAVTVLLPDDHDPGGPRAELLRSAGEAIEGVDIRIVDPATGEACAEGAVGEVWLRTRQNMKGYWANPEATAEALVGRSGDELGWLRTGDAGYMQGRFLFLHDRIKDMIVSGGENIYPAEVENALMAHPAIADGAIIGIPDEKWGETVMACVVVKPDAVLDEQELIEFMRERIAHFKCPRRVAVLDEIPRNPTGKILKRVLREPYWEGVERRVN